MAFNRRRGKAWSPGKSKAKPRGLWSEIRKFTRNVISSEPIDKKTEKVKMKRSDISKELHRNKKNGNQEMTTRDYMAKGMRHAYKKIQDIGGGNKNPRW